MIRHRWEENTHENVLLVSNRAVWARGVSRAGPFRSECGQAQETRVQALMERAGRYSDAQEYDRAIGLYNEVLRIVPNSAEAYNSRGYAYYYKGGGDAIADYTRAIALRPDYATAFNNRGAAYMASGDANKAILDLNRAIRLRPHYPRAYSNRGNAHLRLGHLRAAIADFKRTGRSVTGLLVLLAAAPFLFISVSAAVLYRLACRMRLLNERKRTVSSVQPS